MAINTLENLKKTMFNGIGTLLVDGEEVSGEWKNDELIK